MPHADDPPAFEAGQLVQLRGPNTPFMVISRAEDHETIWTRRYDKETGEFPQDRFTADELMYASQTFAREALGQYGTYLVTLISFLEPQVVKNLIPQIENLVIDAGKSERLTELKSHLGIRDQA